MGARKQRRGEPLPVSRETFLLAGRIRRETRQAPFHVKHRGVTVAGPVRHDGAVPFLTASIDADKARLYPFHVKRRTENAPKGIAAHEGRCLPRQWIFASTSA